MIAVFYAAIFLGFLDQKEYDLADIIYMDPICQTEAILKISCRKEGLHSS
jgi:hypothetical protein